MKAFLTMKHWQLFLLLFAVPILGVFIALIILILMQEFKALIFAAWAVNIISISILILWQYTLVKSLNERFSSGINMNIFIACLIVPVAVVAVIFYAMFGIIRNPESIPSMDPRWLLLVLPLAALSMACSIFVLYTMAKSLVSVEQNRQVDFSDFILEFILFWFWIVGIWILQPRINEIFNEHRGTDRMIAPPPIPVYSKSVPPPLP